MTRNDGGAGRCQALSKTARSCLMVGDPNGTMITIVWPFPVMPWANSGPVS